MKEYFSGKAGIVRAVCLLAVFVTVVLGVFNGILNVLFFEEKIYMYDRDSEVCFTVYYTVCAIVTAVVGALYIVNKRKKDGFSCDSAVFVSRGFEEKLPFRILRALGGAVFTFGAFGRLTLFFMEKNEYGLHKSIVVLMLLFLVCLSFYFFSELDQMVKIEGFTAFCGMLGVVAFIIDTLAVYSDMSIPIASEYRLFTAVYSVLFLLALVLEIRMKTAEPNSCGYVAMFSVASVVGGSTCIGRVISIFCDKAVSDTELTRTVCGVGITVYMISRLLSIAFAPKYIADCGGNSPITVDPMDGDEFVNCDGAETFDKPSSDTDADETLGTDSGEVE